MNSSSLSTLGIVHTALSLVALLSGFIALARYKQVRTDDRLGQTYLFTTFLTAATGLGLFAHGGFGPPHVLSLLTIAAIALGLLAGASTLFGAAAPYVQAVCFSTTFFFHLIPGFTETLTRLPPSSPVLASAEAPVLKLIALVLLLGLVAGLFFQLRWLRRQRSA